MSENFKYVEHVKSKKFLDLFDPDEAIVTDDNERKKLIETSLIGVVSLPALAMTVLT